MARIAMTGGPGAGKTTLLLALQARGYTIVGDSPRAIIQDRLQRGLSPRPDADTFVHETLRMDIDNYVRHAATPGYVFFDRSVLDALCGLDHLTTHTFRRSFSCRHGKRSTRTTPNAITRSSTLSGFTGSRRRGTVGSTAINSSSSPRFRLPSGVRLCSKRWQIATPNHRCATIESRIRCHASNSASACRPISSTSGDAPHMSKI
jgi:hypothetical protein